MNKNILERIEKKLAEIKAKKINTSPYSKSIHFNDPIDYHDIAKFEIEMGIQVPEELKSFIQKIGNGGFGPGYSGLIPLGKKMLRDPRVSIENNDRIDLKSDFMYTKEWNYDPLISELDNELFDNDDVLKYYFSVDRISGAICICDLGCGAIVLLVVKGNEYGKVWIDYRGDYSGISPINIPIENPNNATFLEWYEAWLDEIYLEVPFEKRQFL